MECEWDYRAELEALYALIQRAKRGEAVNTTPAAVHSRLCLILAAMGHSIAERKAELIAEPLEVTK